MRALATSTYGPTFVAELGLGAMLPLFTLSVLRMDGSAWLASAAVAFYSAGRIAGSAWGGRIGAKLGSVRAAMASLGVLAGGAALAAVSPGLVPLLLAVTLIGLGHAAYHVSRQGQIAGIVSHSYRARALTSLAGTWRIANFIGPVLGAGLIGLWGLRAGYAMATVAVLAGMVALRLSHAWRERRPRPTPSGLRAIDVIRHSWPVIRTLGFAVLLTGAIRAARIVVIPLWAAHLGLSDQVTSLVFAVSAAVDMLLFYPAGVVMDRFGRAWTAVPSTLLLSVGIGMLPQTSGLVGVGLASILLGIGNGWGSGVLMTLGADVAPLEGRDMFIATWMILQDAGGLAGPAIISACAVVALPLGFYVVGGLGFATSGALYRWIPPWRLAGVSGTS